MRRKPITVAVDDVDVGGSLGDSFIEKLCALVDQRKDASLDNLVVRHIATHVSDGACVFRGQLSDHRIFRAPATCVVCVVTGTGLAPDAFWQGVAIIFGSNLKQTYEPKGKDLDMEKIVRDVERMYGYKSS